MGERRIKTKVRTKVLIEIIFDGYDISEIRDKYATFELGKLEDEKKRIAQLYQPEQKREYDYNGNSFKECGADQRYTNH